MILHIEGDWIFLVYLELVGVLVANNNNGETDRKYMNRYPSFHVFLCFFIVFLFSDFNPILLFWPFMSVSTAVNPINEKSYQVDKEH